MKNCIKCGPQNESCFNKKTASKDGLQPICRTCHSKQRAVNYRENKSKIIKRVDKNNTLYKRRNAQFIWDYLKKHPCVDCGEVDPVVLEFDHIQDKKHDVSYMATHCRSLLAIEQEITKCEVRCANCHRRKTAIQFNYHKDIVKQ